MKKRVEPQKFCYKGQMIHLVTGGSGFLGTHLLSQLKESYPNDEIISLGLSPSKINGIKEVRCNLLDQVQLEKEIRLLSPDRVYHLAGVARVQGDIEMGKYFDLNYLTTVNLMESLERLNKPITVFFASSVHVYGNQVEPVNETTHVEPIGDYGFTKYLAEGAIRTVVMRAPYMQAVIGRLYSCIGPGQPNGFVVSDFCQKILSLSSSDESLKVGWLKGIRQFTDVRDVVSLIPKLTQYEGFNRFEIVNIASGSSFTVEALLNKLLEVAGKSPQVDSPQEMGSNQFLGIQVNTDKLFRVLPHQEFRPLDQTLKDTFEWSKRERV